MRSTLINWIGCLYPPIIFGRNAEALGYDYKQSCWNYALIYYCPLSCNCIIHAPVRAEIRRRYGIKESRTKEMCLTCCCSRCALLQEYVQLKEAQSRDWPLLRFQYLLISSSIQQALSAILTNGGNGISLIFFANCFEKFVMPIIKTKIILSQGKLNFQSPIYFIHQTRYLLLSFLIVIPLHTAYIQYTLSIHSNSTYKSVLGL